MHPCVVSIWHSVTWTFKRLAQPFHHSRFVVRVWWYNVRCMSQITWAKVLINQLLYLQIWKNCWLVVSEFKAFYLFSQTYEKTLKLPRSYLNINIVENQIETMKILLQKSYRKSDCNYEDIITKILQKIRLQLWRYCSKF